MYSLLTFNKLIEESLNSNEVKYLEEAWHRLDKELRSGCLDKKLQKVNRKKRKKVIKIFIENRELFKASKLEAFVSTYS